VSRGAVVGAASRNSRTPLHCAAEMGHVTVVTSLLAYGAATDAEDYVS
jgi:ankyrin repeat protein